MQKDTEEVDEMSMQEIMEVYRKFGTPSTHHKVLESMAGSWITSIRAWMNPEEPPTESTGTAEHKLILGGRFLQEEMSGQMMGDPFNGIGFMGYDNHTGKYISTWMDSMSTSIMLFEGTASEDGKTITQTTRYDDPIQGPMEYRAVTTLIDNSTFEFEMYGKDKTGKEDKMMEMTYTRK
jgi:hypothetical protein